ncbi:hypothetical protein F4779DRAFT_635258 [Xylariaceae sp. FL0662B]|nr:hypothetical protein F4779DRAFT_635258 [Xylariaceae sp. FL0662B]
MENSNEASGGFVRHISLKPISGDEFPVDSEIDISKSNTKELFSFNIFQTKPARVESQQEEEAQEANRPNPINPSTTAASTIVDSDVATSMGVFSTTGEPPIPAQPNQARPDYTDYLPVESRVPRSGDFRPRILAIPGHAPHYKEIPESSKTFTFPIHMSVDASVLAFEDLCYAAKEKGKLDDIRSASFVTDTETLAAIFEMLSDHQFQTSRKARNRASARVSIHTVHGTTFMKVDSSNAFIAKDKTIIAATEHLRREGLDYCGSVEHQQKERTAHKRVISYDFGNIGLVVEDSNTISRTKYTCAPLPRGVEYSVFQHECTPNSTASQDKIGLFAKPTGLGINQLRIQPSIWFSDIKQARLVKYAKNSSQGHMVADRAHFSGGTETLTQSKLNAWTQTQQTRDTIRLMHRLLRYIKDISDSQARQGHDKLVLQHYRVGHNTLTLKWEPDSQYGIDLVSAAAAKRLGEIDREES